MHNPAITLFSDAQALPHPPGSVIFRQSPLKSLIGLLVLDTISTVLAVSIISGKLPWGLWLLVGVFALVNPFLIRSFLRSLSPGNWAMRLEDRAVCVRFRPAHRQNDATDTPSACRIPFELIESVCSVQEKFRRRSKSNRNSTESWTEYSMQFSLTEGGASDLFIAIQDDRRAGSVDPTTNKRRAFIVHNYPVRMPDPDTLRLKFHGSADWITPRLKWHWRRLKSVCRLLNHSSSTTPSPTK